MSLDYQEKQESCCLDIEWQLAINAYKNLRKTLGAGTLERLQRIIEDLPLTKRTSQAEIRGIDVLDDDD